jgi:hypothetical protein
MPPLFHLFQDASLRDDLVANRIVNELGDGMRAPCAGSIRHCQVVHEQLLEALLARCRRVSRSVCKLKFVATNLADRLSAPVLRERSSML